MGMDFFGHQDQARKASGRLVWLFVAAVVCIILLIYAAAKAFLIVGDVSEPGLVDLPVLGAVAGAVSALVVGAMAFKSAQLRGGGAAIAEMMGGRLVDPHTRDPQERVLMNVVEEMSIASGVPVPDVFVLEAEAGVNAFAAGWSTKDAAVAVTKGALETFSRDELQGVIAHEFSHIFHGDMRLNIRLVGTLFGIICLTVIGRVLLHAGRGSKRDGQHVAIFGLVLVAVGYIGVLFARLIQAAISRQREYLADAAAVQYTRNPKGIGMALAKLGGLTGKLESPHAEEASHMMFADAVTGLGGGLATHPPIEERVERVLPGCLKHAAACGSLTQAVHDTPAPTQPTGAAGFAGPTPQRVLQTVGDPQPQHVEAARALLSELPLHVGVSAHEPARAPALIYSLLLDRDDAERTRQLAMLDASDGGARLEAQSLYAEVSALPRTMHLPLVELAMPTLRRLPREERAAFLDRARALSLSDGRLSAFEFALLKALERHLPIEGNAKPRRRRTASIAQRAEDAGLVLSVIARAGAENEEEVRAAFERGCLVLGIAAPPLSSADAATPRGLDRAIDGLDRVSPLSKRRLIEACAEVAAHDGHLDPDEVDLVRALAELWDCPVPISIPT